MNAALQSAFPGGLPVNNPIHILCPERLEAAVRTAKDSVLSAAAGIRDQDVRSAPSSR